MYVYQAYPTSSVTFLTNVTTVVFVLNSTFIYYNSTTVDMASRGFNNKQHNGTNSEYKYIIIGHSTYSLLKYSLTLCEYVTMTLGEGSSGTKIRKTVS